MADDLGDDWWNEETVEGDAPEVQGKLTPSNEHTLH